MPRRAPPGPAAGLRREEASAAAVDAPVAATVAAGAGVADDESTTVFRSVNRAAAVGHELGHGYR